MATCATFGWKPKSEIQKDVLDELLHTDCVAKTVLTEKMQETTDRVSKVCDKYDLTIRKTNNGIGEGVDGVY